MNNAGAAPNARADLAVLSRSQDLSRASDPAAQGRPAGTVRPHLHAQTGFVALDRLLARLHANKPIVMVLDRPKMPLHTNGSENDIRCQSPSERSAAARSDTGRTAVMPSSASARLAQNSASPSGIRPRLTPGSTKPARGPILPSNRQASLRHRLTAPTLPSYVCRSPEPSAC